MQQGEINTGYLSGACPADVFNNPLVYYNFEEFSDDSKESNGSILALLKRRHTVDIFHKLGKHISFRQWLNSFV